MPANKGGEDYYFYLPLEFNWQKAFKLPSNTTLDTKAQDMFAISSATPTRMHDWRTDS